MDPYKHLTTDNINEILPTYKKQREYIYSIFDYIPEDEWYRKDGYTKFINTMDSIIEELLKNKNK